jgi:hypothetical protein
MVEEGTVGLVRSNEPSGPLSKPGEDSSKDELQHRMEAARESISNTVDEIKDTVVNQYESVKESVSQTLDWHEQVKRRPVAWSAGALGAGFVVGYGVAAVVKGPPRISIPREKSRARINTRAASASDAAGFRQDEANEGSDSGLIQRIKETPAYDRVKSEASVIGNRFVDEISKKAQEVLLPAVLASVGGWLEGLLPAKPNKQTKAN